MRPVCSRGSGIRAAVLGAVCLLAGAVAAPASDWSRWRGPEGTGVSAEKGWKPQALSAAKVAEKRRGPLF